MAVVYQVETHQNSRLAEAQIREMSQMYQDLVSEIVETGQQEYRGVQELHRLMSIYHSGDYAELIAGVKQCYS